MASSDEQHTNSEITTAASAFLPAAPLTPPVTSPTDSPPVANAPSVAGEVKSGDNSSKGSNNVNSPTSRAEKIEFVPNEDVQVLASTLVETMKNQCNFQGPDVPDYYSSLSEKALRFIFTDLMENGPSFGKALPPPTVGGAGAIVAGAAGTSSMPKPPETSSMPELGIAPPPSTVGGAGASSMPKPPEPPTAGAAETSADDASGKSGDVPPAKRPKLN